MKQWYALYVSLYSYGHTIAVLIPSYQNLLSVYLVLSAYLASYVAYFTTLTWLISVRSVANNRIRPLLSKLYLIEWSRWPQFSTGIFRCVTVMKKDPLYILCQYISADICNAPLLLSHSWPKQKAMYRSKTCSCETSVYFSTLTKE